MGIKHLFFKKGMLPTYLIFNVTYRCNSRCLTCFAWQDIKKAASQKELDLGEIKKVSAGLKKIEWLLLSGGEPFLRKEIDDICYIFYKQNKTRRITIPTNCLLPEVTERKTEDILRKCKKANVVISLALDGIGQKHDIIRGVRGNFKKLVETYERLCMLKKKYKRLSINLNTVLMNRNIDDVRKITEYTSQMKGVDFHGFELLRGMPRDSKLKTPTWQEYEKALKIIRPYWKRFGFYNMRFASLIRAAKILGRDIELESLRKGKRVIPCYAGAVSGVIGSFGDVQLCELMPTVGNLRKADYKFSKVWFSKEAERQRDVIHKRAGICSQCTHSCFVASTLLFDPMMYPKLVRYMIKY